MPKSTTRDWETAQREAERRRATGTALTPAPRIDPRVAAVKAPASLPNYRARPVQPLVTRQPVRRAVTGTSLPKAPAEATPVKPAEKRLREAAKGVIDAWENGDLANAVRTLDMVLNGGVGAIGRPVLRNLYHPASYRTSYEVMLTGEELMRLQLLTNAVSMNGPVGTTAFLIKPKEMAWAKERLRKIREAK